MTCAGQPAVRREGDDLLLTVHAQPGASRSGFAGLHDGVLKIRIQAPAVDGRANEALRRFLAEACAVAPAQVTLVSGASARHKRWRIARPGRIPAELAALLPP